MTKPLDGVARGHIGQTVETAGYAIIEERVRQALRLEAAKLQRKGLSERESDHARGYIEACEWFLRLPGEILRSGNSSGA